MTALQTGDDNISAKIGKYQWIVEGFLFALLGVAQGLSGLHALAANALLSHSESGLLDAANGQDADLFNTIGEKFNQKIVQLGTLEHQTAAPSWTYPNGTTLQATAGPIATS